MNFKSILAGSLAAVTIFSFAGGRLLSAAPVQAATADELQAQVTALLAQIAALSGSSSSSCMNFTMNLTMGSNNAEVKALQVYLNKKGYTVALSGAGSMGMESTYFGGLTRSALAKYQAAMGISPAAGYFGPISRAKVNADCTGTGTTGTGTTGTTGLNGGEANLNSFDLRREDSIGAEGDSKVVFATAKFDVDDGDARVERIKLVASSTNSSLEKNPWKYFSKVYVMDGSKVLTSMSVSSRDDWSEEGSATNIYSLTINNVGYVAREGDRVELSLAFDINDNINSSDLSQSFSLWIPDSGIRATDAAGVQQYTGMTSDKISFGFEAAQNGSLAIRSSDNDPSAAILVADDVNVSAAYDVFKFDIKNSQSADSLLTDVVIIATTTSNLDALVQKATLSVGGKTFTGDITNVSSTSGKITFPDVNVTLKGDSLTSLSLSTTLARNASGTVQYGVVGSSQTAEGASTGDNVAITGTASGATHTIALTGIVLAPVSTAQTITTPSSNASDTYGTFTIKFKVTAVEDDAYIASTTSALGTAGINYTIVGSPAFAGTTSSLVSVDNATLTSGFYKVASGATATFTLSVSLNPSAAGTYEVDLSSVKFNTTPSLVSASTFTVDTRDGAYKTSPIFITQ